MYRYNARSAQEDFTVETTKIVTHRNLNLIGLKTAAEAVIGKIIYPIKSQEEFDKITGKTKQAVDAVIRGLENIFSGLPFSVFADEHGLTGLVVQSASREHQYIVTTDDCQCEGHKNHGVCYHRALHPVFTTYIGLLRIHERFQRDHQALGIELTIQPDIPISLFGGAKSLDDIYESLMKQPPQEGERGM